MTKSRPGRLRRAYAVSRDAVDRFIAHDNWAIASDIALSVLTSLFPS